MATKPKGWRLVKLRVRGHRFHVYPLADLRRHELTAECWCHPRTARIERGGYLTSHNAEDGRELIERHGLQ